MEKGRDAKREEKGSGLDAIHKDDTFLGVGFAEADLDDFGGRGLDGAADELSLDGHFAVSAIDENAEGDAAGTAEIEKAIHGGADRATGIEDVVHEDKLEAIHAERDVGGLENGLGSDAREVVAIEGDIERADGDFDAIDAAHGLGDAIGERNAAATDADEGKVAGAAALLDDLVGETLHGAVDLGSGHELRFFH